MLSTITGSLDIYANMEDNRYVPKLYSGVSFKKDVDRYDLSYASHIYKLGIKKILCGYVFYQVTEKSREWAGGYWCVSICRLDSAIHQGSAYLPYTETVLVIERYLSKYMTLYKYHLDHISRQQALDILVSTRGRSEYSIERQFLECDHPECFEILSPGLSEVRIVGNFHEGST
jgi:hypothetical protein